MVSWKGEAHTSPSIPSSIPPCSPSPTGTRRVFFFFLDEEEASEGVAEGAGARFVAP
jgi:hypothetical protein